MDLIQKIKDYANRIVFCGSFGHDMMEAGSCPFTGVTYDYCKRCNHMIPREYVN